MSTGQVTFIFRLCVAPTYYYIIILYYYPWGEKVFYRTYILFENSVSLCQWHCVSVTQKYVVTLWCVWCNKC